MKKIYKEYANIKAKIEELQTKADIIKKQIELDMIDRDTKKEVLPDVGQYILCTRSTWSYSDVLKAEIIKMQKKEQATKKAKQKITTSLIFKSI